MQRYSRTLQGVAVALAALAGFVDAYAFMDLGGFFVSFMSGNSTRLGVALGSGAHADAVTAISLIACFVGGVMIASLISRHAQHRRKAAVMALVTALLMLAAWLSGDTSMHLTPVLLIAMAMGAENGVYARDGEVTVGVTYFTGTLVRFGQKLVGAMTGDSGRFDWLPHLLLWIGFVCGVTLGAHAYRALADNALWWATGVAAVLTILLWRFGRLTTS